MDLRPLGRTGIDVSPLALGTVKLGRNQGVRYPRAFDIPDDRAAAALLALAAELGINTLDTAPAYGESEERLGLLLSSQRDRWVICTKAGETFDGAESTFDFSDASISASVERSLRRLRTDRVDIALVHCPDADERTLRETPALGALRRLQEQGKVRAVGASTKTPSGAAFAAEHCDVVMLAYNPVDDASAPAIDRAASLGVGVLVKKALLSGHLPPGAEDPVERCLRFAFARPGVSAVVVGTIDPRHLEHDADAARRALRAAPNP